MTAVYASRYWDTAGSVAPTDSKRLPWDSRDSQVTRKKPKGQPETTSRVWHHVPEPSTRGTDVLSFHWHVCIPLSQIRRAHGAPEGAGRGPKRNMNHMETLTWLHSSTHSLRWKEGKGGGTAYCYGPWSTGLISHTTGGSRIAMALTLNANSLRGPYPASSDCETRCWLGNWGWCWEHATSSVERRFHDIGVFSS